MMLSILTLLLLHCGGCFSFRRLPIWNHVSGSGTKSNKLRDYLDNWTKEAVPAGYLDASEMMTRSLITTLQNDASLSRRRLLSVDILTPGLNPKLEQKAMLMQEYLFDLVRSLVPALEQSQRFRQVKLMFPSMGDAAGYQKYSYQVDDPLCKVDGCTMIVKETEVNARYIEPGDDCAVFITSRNHIGDPVINEIQKIVETNPSLTCIFLNCDLRDRVTSGIVTRGLRDEFRASIEPAFYFRNIVQIVRPTLVPIELGALIYTPSMWEIYAVNTDDIVGPGAKDYYLLIHTISSHDHSLTTSAQ